MNPEFKFVETWDGEPITAIQEFKGELLVFTRTAVYKLRRMRRRDRLWLRMKKLYGALRRAYRQKR